MMRKLGFIMSVSLILLVGIIYSEDTNPERLIRFSYQHQQSQLMDNHGRWFDSLNVRFVGNWPFGTPYAVATDTTRDLVFFSCGGGVYIYDMSNPASPIKLSEKIHTRSRFAYDLFYDYANHRLYTAGGWGTKNEIWDVSNPSNPIKLGGWDTQYFSWGIFVSGSYAYVADDLAGLRIVNISDPANPYEVSYNNTIGYAHHVAVSDTYAYVASDSLFIFNISDQANPYIVGHYNASGRMFIQDTLLYMTGSQFRIISISDPTNPYEIGHFAIACSDISISDSLAYIISEFNNADSLYIFNIFNPANPYIVGRCDKIGWEYGMELLNSHLYISDEYSILHIINVSNPFNPQEENFLHTTGPATGVTVCDSFAYIAENRGGVRIINILNPADPYEVGYYDTPGRASSIAISDSLAYVADYEGGLRIINISNPMNGFEVGHFDVPSQDAIYVTYRNPYVYLINYLSGDGLKIINVSDPANPFEVGHFTPSGRTYTTWITVVDTLAYLACFIDQTSGFLYVINITNPANPYEIGNCAIAGCCNCIAIKDNYAYISSGLSGLRIINIADPANPFEVGSFSVPENYYSGIILSGSYAYIADYAAWSLHVIDVTNPTAPQQVGYYETPDSPFGITLLGGYIGLADDFAGLQIYENYANSINETTNTPINKNLRILQNPIKNNFINLVVQLPEICILRFNLYDAIGQKVKNYKSICCQAGTQNIKLPIKDLPAGIYFLCIRINDIQTTEKILIIK
jgi:hypothetical protein